MNALKKPAPVNHGLAIAKKPAAPPPVDVEIPVDLIDAFGEAKRLHDEFAPVENLYQKLYRQVKGYTDAMDAADGGFFEGNLFSLEVSERAMAREVDIAAARKTLGATQFMQVATVTQTALNTILPKPAVEALLVESQSGPRKFVTLAREAAAASDAIAS